MADQCEEFCLNTVERITQVLADKCPGWDEDPAALWQHAGEHNQPLYQSFKKQERQMEEAWACGNVAVMRKTCSEWGRSFVELVKGYCKERGVSHE